MTAADLAGREPIAIVGIGCRLPGGAGDPDSLWRLLCDEFDAIGPVPPGRVVDPFEDERVAGRVTSRSGGFLTDIDRFDSEFFEMAPREAERLDPQQRLLLETSWEALEDAGVTRDDVAGSNAGVFVGMWLDDFESHLFADPAGVDLHMTTGSGRYSASGRLSFFLDLRGPSLSIDTACSSSLVAVHLACQSLRSGECDLALAGGANVILQPHITVAYSHSGMMATDGRCKFGDASADGYVRSDGAAMVVLKRLSSALADGDPIYAVVRGSAVTNDGRSSGFLSTPGRAGQELMLRRAYEDAGVDPRSVQYVEAHGTGTAAGDPVELGALGAVVGAGRDEPCLVGSLKTNVGHTEGAAGVAGLIKVALSLSHGEIPASIHLRTPNPEIPWAEAGLEVCTARRPWPVTEGPARAGVSSFGIAGTNAHIVLEAPPLPTTTVMADDRRMLVLPISAPTRGAVQALLDAYHAILTDQPAALSDVCNAAARQRTHHDVRLAVAADDAGEMATLLASASPPDGSAAAPQVVFVFPGQGAQWHGMARELLEAEPAFRAAMIDCDAAIRHEAGWSLLEELAKDGAASRVDEIDVVQPVLFAIQVALAAQWRAWGVEPSAVVGHSMGEVAAAYVAGALSLPDAVAVICRRSRLMRRVAGRGAMALVELSLDEAVDAIAGREDKISIAVSNGPRSTVISGDGAALDAVLAELKSRDVFSRHVKVDVASHSPQMDPLLDELRAGLAGITTQPATVPIHSTVDGGVVEGTALDASYWARNLRQPVLFGATTEQVARSGHTVFVEISPHPVLASAIGEVLRRGGHPGSTIASMRRCESERFTMLSGLAALYGAGVSIDWRAVYPNRSRRVRLPSYPWQREHFWFEPRPAAVGGHPLLGHAVRPASAPGTVCWETTLDGRLVATLRDHVVRGTAVVPATAFVELAVAAADAAEPGAHALAELAIVEVLPLGERVPIQVVVEPAPAGGRRVRVFAGDDDGGWRLHAEGRVVPGGTAPAPSVSCRSIRTRCDAHHAADAHHDAMQARGLHYGPAFRTVAECWRGPGEALGRLSLAPDVERGHAARVVLLDGALQLAVAALPPSRTTFVPVGAERVEVGDIDGAADLWAHATVAATADGDVRGDVVVFDASGRVVAEVSGLGLKPAGRGSSDLDGLLYELQWVTAERPPAASADASAWLVFASPSVGADLATRLRRAGHRGVVVRAGAPYARTAADEFTIDPSVAAHYASLLTDAFAAEGCAGIVYAWPPAIPAGDGEMVVAAETLGAAAPVALVQALDTMTWPSPPRLWLVTRGAQAGGAGATGQAVTWGLGRVLATERPEHRCTLIDVDPAGRDGDDGDLFQELLAAPADQQVVLRGDDRRVARLVRRTRPAGAGGAATEQTDAYRLVATVPGDLDSIRPAMIARRPPGAGEVELKVVASGLNFLDVLKAMGICPGFDPDPCVALGAECAATVAAIGPGVDGLAVGDRVMAITSSYRDTSMMSAYVTLPVAFVVRQPDHLTAEQAAGLPVALLTAHYALVELARIRPGDRVLVHAATGGVGLAALEICRRVGAAVIATAGSAKKRAFLRSLGVEHVFDSRSTAFADEVRACTGGRGVDVVLNSLTGEAIAAGLSSLAPRGRFVEIGKRDIYADTHVGLQPFARNLSFFAVDLARLTDEEPAYVAGLFREVMALVAAGELGPLPTVATPVADAVATVRTMAQAAHIGKLVVTGWDGAALVDAPFVRPDATYLVTGGMGALGLAAAQHLADRGARCIALVGRGTPSAAATAAIARLEARGVRVATAVADVADREQLSTALAHIAATLPPLRGVVHAAGVLADATIARMDRAALRAALAPKLAGAWNLHVLTADQPLDFFVLYSSVASVLGLAGQANYAAGNAFLDALAHERRAGGRPALAVNWGPWAEIGLAAADANRGRRLADRGLGSLTPGDGLDALDVLLAGRDTQVAVMPFAAERWTATEATATALLSSLADAAPAPVAGGLRTTLAAIASADRRQRALEDAVCAQLGSVLRLVPDRIDRQRPLKALGLDSLMALELRNRLEAEVGSALPATVAWNYPTVASLAGYLAERLDVPVAASAPEDADVPEPMADEWADLSQDDLEALLTEELAAVDELLRSE